VPLENGSRVVALPADAVTIRGYSAAKLLIIDEAAYVNDETLTAVRPMLAVSNGRMVAMSTPHGRRGWFYEASRPSEWRVTKVRAEECPRITKEFLEVERASMGEWRYRQEYECEFVDVAGLMFRSDDIEAMFAGPAPGISAGNEGLFGAPRPRRALPAPKESKPQGPYCPGHLWRDGSCVRCGFPQPALAAAGVA